MKNLMKLVMGFALGGLTAVMAQLAPMIVPAILCVIAAVIIIDSVSDTKAAA